MNGECVRDSIYGCRSYAEFKLKLGVFGFKNIPPEDVFNICHPDDWKWEVFLERIKCAVDDGKLNDNSITWGMDYVLGWRGHFISEES
jgi:hypothetical protein